MIASTWVSMAERAAASAWTGSASAHYGVEIGEGRLDVGGGVSFKSQIQRKYPGLDWPGIHHAGNSSGVVDGAAAILLTSKEFAEANGLKPRARFVSTAVAAADPVIQFTAVLDATRKALTESGLTPADIDLFEVNEAFGGVPLMFQQEFGIPDERLNVNGGSMAIGHPLGSTGARMLTDLLCELERRGGRYGLQTICEASGTANTTIIERLG